VFLHFYVSLVLREFILGVVVVFVEAPDLTNAKLLETFR